MERLFLDTTRVIGTRERAEINTSVVTAVESNSRE